MPGCPVIFREMSESDDMSVPLLNQILYLTNLVEDAGKLKLTKKGVLPVSVVAEIYEQGFLKDWDIEAGISKLYNESNSYTTYLTHIILNISGISKKRNGKLRLTKKSCDYIKFSRKCLKRIFKKLAEKFNWAYFDVFGENHIGQLGYGFTLVLLYKYGDEKKTGNFYAEKFFEAFPHLIDTSLGGAFSTPEKRSVRCYTIRSFERFIDHLCLISIEK